MSLHVNRIGKEDITHEINKIIDSNKKNNSDVIVLGFSNWGN
jgi:hypothetical protein